MTHSRYSSHDYLFRAALINFVSAFFHIVVPFNGVTDYIYISTNKFALLEMQRSPLPEPANLLLALVFAVFGMYCLSGAEMMRPLPWLNPTLWFIGGLYTLRGSVLVFGLLGLINEPLPPIHLIVSMLALVIGVMILIGMRKKNLERAAIK